MFKRSVIYLLLTLFHVCVFAQGGMLMDKLDPEYQNSKLLYTTLYSNVQGSAYFGNQETWDGEVFFSEGSSRSVKLQYDLVRDILIYVDDQNNPLVLDTKYITKFILRGISEYSFVKLMYPNASGFYQVLSTGYISFYTKPVKEIIKSETKESGYSSSLNTKDKIRSMVTYYFSDESKLIKVEKLNNESVFEALDQLGKNGRSKTKELSLKLKKEEDVMKLLQSL